MRVALVTIVCLIGFLLPIAAQQSFAKDKAALTETEIGAIAWSLGRDQGLLAITFHDGASGDALPAIIKRELGALNKRLGLPAPKMPLPSGDRLKDGRLAAEALIKQSPSTFNLIKTKYGEKAAYYYVMALRLQILSLMYEPKSPKNKTLMDALELCRAKAGLPPSLLTAVSRAVNSGIPAKQLLDETQRADNAARKAIWLPTESP